MKKLVKKFSFTQLLLEFVSVVFAVLLALGLNTYKESQDNKLDAELLKASILKECAINKEKIDSILINNQQYHDVLDSLVRLDDDQITGFYFTYDYELLTNGAWQIAMNNPAIKELNQEFLTEAADIYQSQDFYLDFSKRVFENIGIFLSRKDELEEANLALSMYYNIGVMNNSARSLRDDYSNFIMKYDTLQ
jgi:hypothetical protein